MDEIHLSDGAIGRARQRLHPDAPITLPATSFKDAALRVRRRNFYDQEASMYRQKYLGRVVEGQSVNSCRIASAVIALARMGVVDLAEATLTMLERDMVESAVRTNHISLTGDTGPEVPYLIFSEFGLPTGFANTVPQIAAALRAGGCVCFAASGHSRCATEISPDGESIKVFDPLQNTSTIQPLSIMNDRVRIYPMQATTDAVVVYPPNYRPNDAKGELFYPPGIVNHFERVNFSPLPINVNRYKK